ncbi:MAG: MoaD/ThiS family protein [Candidatus Hodarchaeota archaeon]
MPIEIKFFGELREKVKNQIAKGGAPITMMIKNEDIETVSDILKKFTIDESETSHIFVSGIFSGFGKKVNDGDRVAIFPKRMGLLYKWYFKKVEND